MQSFAGYLIAAGFFVGGYGLCCVHWPAAADPPIVCGGHSAAWQRSGAAATAAPTIVLSPRDLRVQRNNDPQASESADGAAIMAKPRPPVHFC